MIPAPLQVIIVLQVSLLVTSHVVIRKKDEVLKNSNDPIEEDAGEPLFLTSYIKAGKIEEGKSASRVGPILPDDDFVSYSGFLTVNEEYNSNLFFWYCPSEQDPENAPVLLWLNGGPGSSSLFGLFEENGPYELKSNGELIRRQYAWTNEFNVLYLDQPVGAGFSFTRDDAGYTRNENDVSRDTYNALVQFFQLFEEYSKNDFYLSGESYAGKYIPMLAYEIHKKNSDNSVLMKINMKGCLIGDGYIDPENMNVLANYMYQLGFIDLKTMKLVHDLEDNSNTYIRAADYVGASDIYGEIWGAVYSFPVVATYSYTDVNKLSLHNVEKVFESDYIRKCVHVGNLEYREINYTVYYNMAHEIMCSVASVFPELLDHYKILLYTGQLDVLDGYPLTRSFVQNLHFNGAKEYYENDLILWYDEIGIHAGHYKVAGNLTDFLALNAGHAVPQYQPKRAVQMVRDFTNGRLS